MGWRESTRSRYWRIGIWKRCKTQFSIIFTLNVNVSFISCTTMDCNVSVGRGDSSHFPHIYNSTKTGRAGIVCSSVMVVPHMTFMHSEYP